MTRTDLGGTRAAICFVSGTVVLISIFLGSATAVTGVLFLNFRSPVDDEQMALQVRRHFPRLDSRQSNFQDLPLALFVQISLNCRQEIEAGQLARFLLAPRPDVQHAVEDPVKLTTRIEQILNQILTQNESGSREGLPYCFRLLGAQSVDLLSPVPYHSVLALAVRFPSRSLSFCAFLSIPRPPPKQ